LLEDELISLLKLLLCSTTNVSRSLSLLAKVGEISPLAELVDEADYSLECFWLSSLESNASMSLSAKLVKPLAESPESTSLCASSKFPVQAPVSALSRRYSLLA
jgi:hypothetical protein